MTMYPIPLHLILFGVCLTPILLVTGQGSFADLNHHEDIDIISPTTTLPLDMFEPTITTTAVPFHLPASAIAVSTVSNPAPSPSITPHSNGDSSHHTILDMNNPSFSSFPSKLPMNEPPVPPVEGPMSPITHDGDLIHGTQMEPIPMSHHNQPSPILFHSLPSSPLHNNTFSVASNLQPEVGEDVSFHEIHSGSRDSGPESTHSFSPGEDPSAPFPAHETAHSFSLDPLAPHSVSSSFPVFIPPSPSSSTPSPSPSPPQGHLVPDSIEMDRNVSHSLPVLGLIDPTPSPPPLSREEEDSHSIEVTHSPLNHPVPIAPLDITAVDSNHETRSTAPTPCQPNPCDNDGSCAEITDPITGLPSFSCGCKLGYHGQLCEIFKVCDTNPCHNNGRCNEGNQTITHGLYTCDCEEGFSGVNCENNINECEGITCPNGKVCIDLVGTYKCECPTGFSGDNCSIPTNYCEGVTCQHGGSCTNGPLKHICTCEPGFRGDFCQEDIDECAEGSPCNNGICQNTIGSFACYCTPGYNGFHCEVEINECLSDPCKHGATCLNLQATYGCECAMGYTGKQCETNINECDPNPCLHGGNCTDAIGSFTCECPPGYDGDKCHLDIDECASHPCLNGGICKDLTADYVCDCKGTGFRGPNCQDNIDECTPNPCHSIQSTGCIDLINDYNCTCHPGFSGKECEEDVKECESNPCLNGGHCFERSNKQLYGVGVDSPFLGSNYDVSKADGFHCSCPHGFIGSICDINIDDCTPDPCENNGTCIDLIADYKCSCPIGFLGKNCSDEYDACGDNPCFNGGRCESKLRSLHYTCFCPNGFSGPHCEVNVDDCDPNPCTGNTVCFDEVAGYSCQCPHGFSGMNCEQNIDDCVRHRCQNGANCIDGIGNYSCSCPVGYRGHFCEQDIDECSLPTKMCSTGNCINTHGGYSCFCTHNEMCRNGGSCVEDSVRGSYYCECSSEFTGPICEQQIASPASQVDVVFVIVISLICVLIIVLLVLSLLFVRSVKKARATRGTYSPSAQEMFGNSAIEILKPPPEERLI